MNNDLKTGNTLSLGPGKENPDKDETQSMQVIIWAANMIPNPTAEKIYQICRNAEDLDHLGEAQIRSLIHKVLQKRSG